MIAIQIKLNEKLYLRDPQQTKLGKKIIQYSIILIEEIGFEKFTFKKLANKISSTEASIYRYFENKHNLLVYLVCWYWEWMKFQIDYNTMNLDDPKRKLKIILSILVESSRKNPAIDYVDENLLHKIVVAESTKAYHTKKVDKENQEGFFSNYQSLTNRIAEAMLEYNPDFAYPQTLASTLIETANNNIYFAEHMPYLTNVKAEENNLTEIKELLEFMAFRLIEP